MNTLFFRSTTILGMAMFCLMPVANAAPGGGACGYNSSEEFCSPTSNNMRVTCKAAWGGAADCTLENCDGTTIELTGPLSGCV